VLQDFYRRPPAKPSLSYQEWPLPATRARVLALEKEASRFRTLELAQAARDEAPPTARLTEVRTRQARRGRSLRTAMRERVVRSPRAYRMAVGLRLILRR
jgi:hypothetical protein